MTILGMKYKEILNIIQHKDLNNFLNEIKKKEIKNGNKKIDSYMESIGELLLFYEEWFYKKKGRSSKKIKNISI